MSKSLGNFTTLKDLFQKFHPLELRFFILQSHYRSTLDFSEEAIASAAKRIRETLNTVRNVRRKRAESKERGDWSAAFEVGNKLQMTNYKLQFTEAMNDDFNTPQVVAMLFDFSRSKFTACERKCKQRAITRNR